jgi:uncharacterized protein (DUF885 family)
MSEWTSLKMSTISGTTLIMTLNTTAAAGAIMGEEEERSSRDVLHAEMAATWQWRIDTDPELAAALGCLSQRMKTHALDPRSRASFQARLSFVQGALERITTQVFRDELTPLDQLSYDLYVQQLTDYCTFTPKHMAYLNAINRLEGPQNDLILYANYLPLKTKEQRLFYLEFLRAIPQQIAENIDLLTLGLELKRTPPQISLDGVVSQLRTMLERGLDTLQKPIANVFPDAEAEVKRACFDQIAGPVTEAFRTLVQFLEKTYIPNLRTEISAVQGYPDGAEYYQDCLQFHTTTTMTAEEIHQLGLDEVARIRGQMLAIAAEEGYADRLDDYLQYLRTAPDYTPTSTTSLIAHYRDVTGRIAPALLRLFHVSTLPRMPCAVTETPAAQAATAPAAYYLAGSYDAPPRPGMFFVNTSELPTRRTYECEALALHEAIPGHHLQGAIQGENDDLPSFRRFQEDRRYFEAPSRFPFYTSYIEGWGLHSETLGKELGLYEHNSDLMGQLSMEALRSCRLVVDTGMHALGWTREQALAYMLQNTAMGEHDAATEVARYITRPGQATAYKVGERFLHRLRAKAEAALREKFDPRDYYDVILQCGPIPLSLLERLVDDYIASQSKSETTATRVPLELSFATAFSVCNCCAVPGACQLAGNNPS